MFVRVQRFPATAPLVSPLFNLEREIEGTFGDLLGMTEARSSGRYPAVDMVEGENESVLVAEVPGMKKDEISISVHDGALTISGERKSPALPEKSAWIRSERSSGKFSRTVQLPHEVNLDAIAAELTDGILRITLPKAESVRPREISVK
jgi:HSP20 family protein